MTNEESTEALSKSIQEVGNKVDILSSGLTKRLDVMDKRINSATVTAWLSLLMSIGAVCVGFIWFFM